MKKFQKNSIFIIFFKKEKNMMIKTNKIKALKDCKKIFTFIIIKK